MAEEREERRKDVSPVGTDLGHKLNRLMTVIFLDGALSMELLYQTG